MAPRKRVLTPGAQTNKGGRPKKVETELEREERISKARSEAGKKGGKARQIQQREQSATALAKWNRGEEMTEAECRRLELDLLQGINDRYDAKPGHEQTNRHREVASVVHGAYMHLAGKTERQAQVRREADFTSKLRPVLREYINAHIPLEGGPITEREAHMLRNGKGYINFEMDDAAYAYWRATGRMPGWALVQDMIAVVTLNRARKAASEERVRRMSAKTVLNPYTGCEVPADTMTKAEAKNMVAISKLHDESRWCMPGPYLCMGMAGPFGHCGKYGHQEYGYETKSGNTKWGTKYPLSPEQGKAKAQIRKELVKAGLLTPVKRGAEEPDQTFDGPMPPKKWQTEDDWPELFDGQPAEMIG